MKNEIIKKAVEIAGGQAQLAAKAGVSQAAIHKLLTGKYKGMRLKTAKGLSDATGIPILEFLNL